MVPAGSDSETTAVIDLPDALVESAPKYTRSDELPPGTQIPHAKQYEIIETLGEGGMGQVYRAYDPTMDRYIALKVLKEGVGDLERKRFIREARLAADFSHPNLVRVLEIGQSVGMQWLTMEWLRGRDIGHVLEGGKQTNFRLIAKIFGQVLDALDYIHVRGIVHCDVKPENIFITRDHYDRRLVIAKLIDFGIARDLNAPPEPTEYISGDPRYMAPEQAVIDGDLGPQADLYALGISFYELVARDHPFSWAVDGDPHTLLDLHRENALPPLSSCLPASTPIELAEALDGFVEKACAKDPKQRFADAARMRDALAQVTQVIHRS